MRVVLDTHALFHAAMGDAQFTPSGTETLENTANELFISAITVWELGLHAERGRIVFNEGLDVWLDRVLSTLAVGVLPIDRKVMRQTFHLSGFDRKDPADRIIVATAICEDAILVTRDEWMAKWDGVTTVW